MVLKGIQLKEEQYISTRNEKETLRRVDDGSKEMFPVLKIPRGKPK